MVPVEVDGLEDLYGPVPLPKRGRPRLEDIQPMQPRKVGGTPSPDLYELVIQLELGEVLRWPVSSLRYGCDALEACRNGEFGRAAIEFIDASGQTLGVADYA